MKNVQIIDSAINGSFSIYAIPDEIFQQLFPEDGQDIEFLGDAVRRLGEKRVGELMKYTWHSRQEKCEVKGIHGTLFMDMEGRKVFYPNKKESDLDNREIQRKTRGIPKDSRFKD
ncbi:MAG TPA: hypothetical protein VGY56_07200 [Verrucomicrobiae bacterium]|nr:hypothetical protein [Verrucomicrobiae bacterium]